MTTTTTTYEHVRAEYIDRTPTYHKDKTSEYALPNDSLEHCRLDTQARLLLAVMNNRLVHSLIDKASVHRVLDVGCGTGVVTDYLAREYPEAEVSGLDISPVPNFMNRPANARFLQGNILTEKPGVWLPSTRRTTKHEQQEPSIADTEYFDLIFSRLLVFGLTDWPRYIRTAFSMLKPGGWVEVHDTDFIWFDKDGKVISSDWAWLNRIRASAEARGMDFSCARNARQRMEEVGLVDVRVTEYRWPFGGQWETSLLWREWGEYGARGVAELLWHAIPRFMDGQPDGRAEVIARMREEMKRDLMPEEGKHWTFRVTCGRKPSK